MRKTDKIQLASTDQCTGCAVCASVCSFHAISMIKGEMGHFYPDIDTNKCIECGRCKTVCPEFNRVDLYPIRKAYAAWAKDKDEYQSSVSGGVASVLSRYIIRQNGVVYGCAMLPDIEVKHIRIDKEEDLALLKGSKYVQSDISYTIPQLKNDVRENKKVLFIGTPCQVAAIRRLYKEQPANLYLVDLICHGVPSLHTLKRHIHKVAASFRSKCNYCLEVTNGDDTIYSKPLKPYILGEDTYLGTFYHGYTFRDSCYSCQYADSLRVGDITIGDFWGLGNEASVDYIKEHPFGCSVVLPCTEHGEDLFQAVSEKLYCYERPISEAVNGNTQLKHPFVKTTKIKIFRAAQRYGYHPALYQILNVDVFIKYLIMRVVRKSKKIFDL